MGGPAGVPEERIPGRRRPLGVVHGLGAGAVKVEVDVLHHNALCNGDPFGPTGVDSEEETIIIGENEGATNSPPTKTKPSLARVALTEGMAASTFLYLAPTPSISCVSAWWRSTASSTAHHSNIALVTR